MSVPTHFRFTARGTFDGTPEAWSFGFHMTRAQPSAGDAHIADINQSAVTSAFAAFFGNSNNIFTTSVKMTDWRAYEIGTNNKMQNNPLVVDVTGAAIHGSSSVRLPTQIALVATLVAANRGPARFGRMYLPGPSLAIGADYRLSDTQAGFYLAATTQLLKDVSDAIDFFATNSSEGCNVSQLPAGGSGTLQVIDHLEVGKVYDTLRTRRRSMLEERAVGGHIDW